MKKVPFVTLDKLQEITAQFPTPFHLYDEKGIRENAKAVKEAFAWNKGFKEFFAVKATPNPFLIQILQEYGCGCDCSSMTELMMSKAIGCKEGDIMFSSNDTPEEEFKYANEIGGIINLDDITHIESVERAVGYIPKVISCRYNPGGVFKISNDIMDNPGDAKYGMTTDQIFEAFRTLKAKGAEEFGIHAFLASNTVTNEYYPMLAKVMFELAVKLQKETGANLDTILTNLRYISSKSANKVTIRVPVIPGFNFNENTLREIFMLAKENRIKCVHLLPYHTLGKDKYEQLGLTYPYPCEQMLAKEELFPFKEMGEKMGLEIRIGG